MTPTVLLGVALAVIAVIVFAVRRLSKPSRANGSVDFGAVSTRWLSELRRDEPWTRS